MRGETCFISNNERDFILSAVKEEQRIDARSLYEMRSVKFSFGKEDGVVEVQLGKTRVLAVVTAELGQPYKDRPTEGSLAIFTEFSPMADPSFEPGRPGEAAIELGRIVDRGLRESRAVDMEALCVIAGRAVWCLRVDLHMLDNGGNLVDAANLAALAALLSFRRPDCSLGGADGQAVIVHPPEVRDPLPLSLHHLPVAITFAFFNDGNNLVVDPDLKEEAAMGGRVTFIVNAHGEICAVQKGGGVPVTGGEILRCARIATAKAKDLADLLKNELAKNDQERMDRKVRRHPASGMPHGRTQVVLGPAVDWGETGQGFQGTAGGQEVEVGEVGNDEDDEEEEEEDDDDEEDDEDVEEGPSESEEEEGQLPTPATGNAAKHHVAAGAGLGRKRQNWPDAGRPSTWQDGGPATEPAGRGGEPAAQGWSGPGAQEVDEFDEVARLLSDAAEKGAAVTTASGSGTSKVKAKATLAAAAVYQSMPRGSASSKPLGPTSGATSIAVDTDEAEGVAMEVTDFQSGGRLHVANEEDEEMTLVSAVKQKKNRRKRAVTS